MNISGKWAVKCPAGGGQEASWVYELHKEVNLN